MGLSATSLQSQNEELLIHLPAGAQDADPHSNNSVNIKGKTLPSRDLKISFDSPSVFPVSREFTEKQPHGQGRGQGGDNNTQGRWHGLVTHRNTTNTPGTKPRQHQAREGQEEGTAQQRQTSRRKLKLKLTITCWSGGMNSRAFWITLQPYICRARDSTWPRMRSASASFCSRLPNCDRKRRHCQDKPLPWPLALPSQPGDKSCPLRRISPTGRA